MRIVGRGRIAKWSREQLDKLSTLELRALLDNAERLKEAEVASICNELLDSRPHGRPAVRRDWKTLRVSFPPSADRLSTHARMP